MNFNQQKSYVINRKLNDSFLWSMVYGLLTISTIFQFSNSYAQGTVTVNAPAEFDVLLKSYKKKYEENNAVYGYRIHIMSSANRGEINNLKAKLYTSFPDIKPFLSYQAPNYKLRVGNYFYKIDAYRDLQKLLSVFPGSFIVNEELKTNEL